MRSPQQCGANRCEGKDPNFCFTITVGVAFLCQEGIEGTRICVDVVFDDSSGMLLMGAAVTAHNWITAGTWRDFNQNDWAFWWTCYLIAPYFGTGLLSLWSGCTANAGKLTDSDSDEESVSYQTSDPAPTKSGREQLDMDMITASEHDDISKPPIVSIEGVESAEV